MRGTLGESYECGVCVSYVLSDGLRHVVPYEFEHCVYAKRRWYGRPLLEVFAAEFFHPSPEYYPTALRLGLLTVNGGPCTSTTPLASCDLIRHRLHRHEPPVTAQPCTLLHRDEHLLVIDKPSSIPIHPCTTHNHTQTHSQLPVALRLVPLSLLYTTPACRCCSAGGKYWSAHSHRFRHRHRRRHSLPLPALPLHTVANAAR